jgi:methylaspartate ammonia-lyase
MASSPARTHAQPGPTPKCVFLGFESCKTDEGCCRYIQDFSKALAGEVKILLAEVGKLRDEKRALQLYAAFRIDSYISQTSNQTCNTAKSPN